MNIQIATRDEYTQLVELDHYVSKEIIACKIDPGEILVAMENTTVIGWLFLGRRPFYEYVDCN